ncbi:putative harbinger transposase-derived nuclease domain-containing protein [Helianthus annuus]|nr:putative harbinger transposase-derived nuclease domain-containing protein [Helianthus annuus]KAJ0749120.1 putative harbinger transposase-derived nuclease domain-containing protein [Helianthus annuus]
MGPIRGSKKKRKIDSENGLASGSSEDGSNDWWSEFSKRIVGSLSPSKGLDQFESVFKVSRKTFNYICSLVNEPMTSKTSNFMYLNGQSMSLNDQVALALRRLSSGDSLIGVGNFFGTNHSTVSQVTWRFVEAIEERGLHHLQWPTTEEEFTQIKSKFENIRGLPNCCGAIDTTHIMMLLSASDRTIDVWLDRKDNHSMMLQVIVDPDMRFRDVVTGYPGKMDDASVLQKSSFHDLSEKGERLNGKKLKLPEGTEIREYIVGDSGFPLLPWLLTPYQGRDLPETKTEFNKRHFATKLVAQRALARLKDVWRVIHGVMWRPDKNRLPRVILACCILHNIMIDMEDDALDELTLTNQHDSGYRPEFCDMADTNASISRDKLALYLSGRLAV